MKIAIKTFLHNSGGFCNRVFSWECIYELSKINNAEIVCDWKELSFLEFPNTIYETNFSNYSGFNSNDSNLKERGFLLDKNKNHIAICGFGFNRYFEKKHYEDKISPKQQIKLKDCDLEKRIEEINKEVIGVHIRRGDYAKMTNDFIFKSGVTLPDKWYFDLMSQYKEKNKDIKFYISSDANRDELKLFYDNFDVLDCETVLGKETPGKGKSHSINHTCSYEDIVDLIALGKTKEIICSVSTWSMFAYQANNKPYIWPETENQSINSVKYWNNIKGTEKNE